MTPGHADHVVTTVVEHGAHASVPGAAVWVGVLAAAAAYGGATRAYRGRMLRTWPGVRTAAWVGGCALVGLAASTW